MVVVLVVLALPFGLTSCLNDDNSSSPDAILAREVEEIDNYLTSHNVTNVIKDLSGIRMVITQLGTGFPAHTYNTVDVDYVGKLFSDGSTFDDGPNIKVELSGLIVGWRRAFSILPAGSRATLYIPSVLGYGDVVKPGIPANSILVFEVYFKQVVPTSADLQRLAADTVAIDNYLASKTIVAEKDSTGLRYVLTQPGTGAIPSWYDKVKITGDIKLLSDDSKVVHTMHFEPNVGFDSRVVDQMPDGLKQGLMTMRAGSKATLYLPSALAYGPLNMSADGTGPVIIPANSNIIIELDFTEVVTP
jgi:FKBP-type peptidyl-prolyl cis-trans isomerase